MEVADLIAGLIVIMGVLVFIVNIIVQLTKELVPIKTDYYVLVLSIGLSILSYFMYLAYSGMSFKWYYLVAVVVIGFFVCYVAQNGWEKFIKLWENSQRG